MFRLYDKDHDERRDRFQRVAPRRAGQLRDGFRRLGNCANRYAYAYEANEVRAMFDGLQRDLDLARAKFLRGPS